MLKNRYAAKRKTAMWFFVVFVKTFVFGKYDFISFSTHVNDTN